MASRCIHSRLSVDTVVTIAPQAIMIEMFHFLRPLWFVALPPLLFLLWRWWQTHDTGAWKQVCDPALLAFVLDIGPGQDNKTRRGFAVLALVLTITALAGPTWEKLPQPVFQTGNDLIVILDLSNSMNSIDISPSRLVQARYAIADLLKLRTEGNTALIVYAADAFVVTPLTSDTATINSHLMSLDTQLMPAQGSRLSTALEAALRLLKQAGVAGAHILVTSDGVEDEDALNQVQRLAAGGHRVSVLAIGTPQGAPIPLSDSDGFVTDRNHAIVIPQLDEVALRQLTTTGGGIYRTLETDHHAIEQLSRLFEPDNNPQVATQRDSRQADIWREQGPWLLIPVIALALFAFRRGVLLLLVFLLPLPDQAYAIDWNNWWLTPDQQAQRAFVAGDHAGASHLFTQPDWQSAAHYRAGEHQQAAERLNDIPGATAAYNRANALAMQGELQAAIDAYQQAITTTPDFDDAIYNRDLVQQRLQEQQQQSQPDESNQAEESKDGEDGDDNQNRQPSSSSQDSNEGDPSESTGSNQSSEENVQPSSEDDSESSQPTEADRKQEDDSQQAADDARQTDDLSPDEQQIAHEQWLRRIPDDPGGLLRRKFLYQYQQRERAPTGDRQAW
ncbi:MAG TPA: VWA domain-containing protein [Chromatiaceae bacterium]|nr:VWA domain-containing protein [Chromatiaceae bacterium]